MTGANLPDSPFRRILFCTDFSPNADHAFAFALGAALRQPGSTLYLLHVIPEPDAQFWKTYIYEVEGVDEKAKRDIDARIARSYRPQVPPELDFRVEMRIGRDYVEILQFARDHEIDLIVLGRHGHTAFSDLLFGSVTEKIVRKAHCPVLIVPMAAARTAEE